MKMFIDLEFIERPNFLEILSIGIVAEDGRELYIQLCETNHKLSSTWVAENVLPHLKSCPSNLSKGDHYRSCDNLECPWRSKAEARRELINFVGFAPEFWGDCAAYDYVAVSWLFGGINADTGGGWPTTWPYFFHDIQAYDALNGPTNYKHPEFVGNQHNALDDARDIKKLHAAIKERIEELEEVYRNN